MLIFQAARGAAEGEAGITDAFQVTFRCAALLTATMAALDVVCGRLARAR
jgi:hypothetical protein